MGEIDSFIPQIFIEYLLYLSVLDTLFIIYVC